MAKSPPRGWSKSCHCDFSWMRNTKSSAKCRASLQLIPPTTLHHSIKASDNLPNDDDFLDKREIGHSLVDTGAPETGAPTNLVGIFVGWQRGNFIRHAESCHIRCYARPSLFRKGQQHNPVRRHRQAKKTSSLLLLLLLPPQLL